MIEGRRCNPTSSCMNLSGVYSLLFSFWITRPLWGRPPWGQSMPFSNHKLQSFGLEGCGQPQNPQGHFVRRRSKQSLQTLLLPPLPLSASKFQQTCHTYRRWLGPHRYMDRVMVSRWRWPCGSVEGCPGK